jgi:hypothetical protein
MDPNLARWLKPQEWRRNLDRPAISLGSSGAFDDTHVFAPCVAFEKGVYWLWYCGSRGAVPERVFRLGLATSNDGVHFKRSDANPVYAFTDGKRSILTPALLRRPDGSALRERGRLRLWFSSTYFGGKDGRHTLHETSSADGVRWLPPSEAQLEHVYAPTVVKEGSRYRMWFTDVRTEPWSFRTADSGDGRRWNVRREPVMIVDQRWETGRLIYPTVLKADGIYLMWYGSYWSAHPNKTAIGFAVSEDGLRWRKSRHNPVLRPDPNRPWESHYTTSQSVLRLADGTWRIWYASRKAPPFKNKYFAICSARWAGPAPSVKAGIDQSDIDPAEDDAAKDEHHGAQP